MPTERNHFIPIWMETWLWDYRHRAISLFLLLLASSNRKAANPVDKIFALLGLASDNLRRNLDIDYDKPVKFVYEQAMATALKEQNYNTFLLAATYTGRSQVLPSWCVDFSCDNWSKWFRLAELYATPEVGCSGRIPRSDIYHDDQHSRLALDGTVVGVVLFARELRCGLETTPADITLSTHMRSRAIECFQRDVLDCCDAADVSLACRFGREHVRRVIQEGIVWETLARGRLLKDAISGTWPKDARQKIGVYAALQYLAEARRPKALPLAQFDSGNDPIAIPPKSDAGKAAEYVTAEFSHLMSETTSFFTTSTGYVARGEHHVKRGDLLCILFGCGLPAVLRPHDDGSYELITSAWVHGIMKGEFVNDGKVERQTFHLR